MYIEYGILGKLNCDVDHGWEWALRWPREEGRGGKVGRDTPISGRALNWCEGPNKEQPAPKPAGGRPEGLAKTARGMVH